MNPPSVVRGPLRARRDARSFWLCALVLLWVVVFQYGPRALGLDDDGLTLWTNAWWIVTAGCAAGLSFVAAARTAGKDRAAWRQIGLGCATWSAGTIIRIMTATSFPGPGDIAHLGSSLFMIHGMFLFCRVYALTRIQLGNFVLALSAVAITLLVVLLPFLRTSVLESRGTAIAFAYVIVWFGTTAFGIMCLVSDTPAPKRPVLRLLIAGSLAQALASFFYSLHLMGSPYRFGAIFDSGWVAAFLLFACAAYDYRARGALKARQRVRAQRTADEFVPATALALVLTSVAVLGVIEVGAVFALFIPPALLFTAFLGLRGRWLGRMERRLLWEAQRSREELSFVLENTIEHAIIFDAERRPVYMNQQAQAFFRRIGESEPWSALPATVRDQLDAAARSGKGRGRTIRFDEFLPAVAMRADFRAFSIGDHLSVIFHEVADEHQARQALEHDAGHDTLTGLVNWTHFRKRLSETCARTDSEGAFAVLSLDLDHFKQVKDTHGHAVGDALLIDVSNRMRGCVRKSDTICRMGGDRFVILQAAPTSEATAAALARRLLGVLGRPFRLGEALVRIEASIGIALGTAPDSDERMLQAADAALHCAKAGGRATFRLSWPDKEASKQAVIA